MVFTKEGQNLISKVIRFDMRRQQWIAGNEAPGTIPKHFWYSQSKNTDFNDQCLASIGTNNGQLW